MMIKMLAKKVPSSLILIGVMIPHPLGIQNVLLPHIYKGG
eukprot:UN10792